MITKEKGEFIMEFKGIKLNIIIIVTLIVIALFFTGQYLYRIYNIDKPIIKEILALDAIKDVRIRDNNNKLDLLLTFYPDIDFFNSYQEINKIMEDKLGNKSGNIIIENIYDNELEDIYYKLHFAIYEGVNTNKFVNMEKNVGSVAKTYNLDNYKIWIDNHAIYVKLDKNNNSFYRRIPYNNTVTVNAEGGDYIG